MKVNVEIEADKDRYTAKINGCSLRSEGNSPAALEKLWMEILKVEVYPGNDEDLDVYCAEEFDPDWPLSAADILDIQQQFSSDGYYTSIDW